MGGVHRHHQNDSCIKMGSDESHFNAYLSTRTVYQYKILKNHYFGGIWPYWKIDTGRHNFHEIVLLL